jgi:hypothetical protein
MKRLLLFLLFCLPAYAAEPEYEEAEYPGQVAAIQGRLFQEALASPTQAAPPPEASVPELGLDEVLSLVAKAFAGKQWGLLGVLALVGLVLLLRKVGGRWLPWLDTPRGAVALSLVGGSCTLLAVALGSGTPLSLGLVLSCVMTAASASGLWSWGQTLKRATPAAVCTPTEIANGTCKPG